MLYEPLLEPEVLNSLPPHNLASFLSKNALAFFVCLFTVLIKCHVPTCKPSVM